jgi:lysozyme
MKVPDAAVQLIKDHESCRLTAYRDGGGVPTIGWGHTAGAHMGLTIMQHQADQWLEYDIGNAARGIARMVKVPLTANQFGALVSFVFNCGLEAFSTSTLLRKLNAGDYDGAVAEFPRWVNDNGQRQEGLVRRRAEEAVMWNTP